MLRRIVKNAFFRTGILFTGDNHKEIEAFCQGDCCYAYPIYDQELYKKDYREIVIRGVDINNNEYKPTYFMQTGDMLLIADPNEFTCKYQVFTKEYLKACYYQVEYKTPYYKEEKDVPESDNEDSSDWLCSIYWG